MRFRGRPLRLVLLFAGLEDILAANDPDSPIIDLDGVDDRVDVALPNVDVRGIEFFIHQPRKRVDLPSINDCGGAALGASMVQRCLSMLPLRFEGGGTFAASS